MGRRILALLLAVSLPSWAGAATIGEPAPDFEVAALQEGGKPLKLSDFKGKVVYLDFWASWCQPCRHSVPMLNAMHRDLAGKDLAILAVNVGEERAAGLNFLKSYPVGYATASDPEGKLAKAYDVQIMPTSYLIDRDGTLRGIHAGFRKEEAMKLRAAVTALVNDKKAEE
jgi:thiol-disulfide isomerase/thioredoxin